MLTLRFDVLVVGAGPAGSVAALVLARAGANVALIDKSRFPRDKACGDLIGPRGVRTLTELGFDITPWRRVADMVVVGPSGARVVLPARAGETYPGYAIVVPRLQFDAMLLDAALEAGAHHFAARAHAPIADSGRLEGFTLANGEAVVGDVVIGADGAMSRVADVAGLVNATEVLWGFAARYYVDAAVTEPHILFWNPESRIGFPGYGWVFPGCDGRANVGLGIGTRSSRAQAQRVVRDLPAFVAHASRHDVVRAHEPHGLLGAWLKMGLVGTVPARRRVLLVGDAAGLVNPLQGEGIAQALDSGRAAATAIIASVDEAHEIYRAHLRRTYMRYYATTASAQRFLLDHPAAVATMSRTLTTPAVGRALAPVWALFWNDLGDGASPSIPAVIARRAGALGAFLTARSGVAKAITASLSAHELT